MWGRGCWQVTVFGLVAFDWVIGYVLFWVVMLLIGDGWWFGCSLLLVWVTLVDCVVCFDRDFGLFGFAGFLVWVVFVLFGCRFGWFVLGLSLLCCCLSVIVGC